MAFTQKGFEHFDATVRGTVACDGLTEQNHYFRAAKMQTNPFKSIERPAEWQVFLFGMVFTKKGFDPSCRAGSLTPPTMPDDFQFRLEELATDSCVIARRAQPDVAIRSPKCFYLCCSSFKTARF